MQVCAFMFVPSCVCVGGDPPNSQTLCVPPNRKLDYDIDIDLHHSMSIFRYNICAILGHLHFLSLSYFFSYFLAFALSGFLSSLLLFSGNFPRHGEGSGSSSGSYVQVFPMQPHRRVFVSPLGFGGPHSRAVPHSADSTMGLYAAKAPLPHITPSYFPPQGHRDSQRAPRHQNANPFNALCCPSLFHCLRYSERGLLDSHRLV